MGKRVLLVDDSLVLRKAMGNALKSAGFEICGEAENGVKGIEQAQQLKPDLIVLDLSMPVMDGLQAGRVLRHSQETLAGMIGTTRTRVNFFMNKFKKLGFLKYNGGLQVNRSLLSVVLHWCGHKWTLEIPGQLLWVEKRQ
jgi:PleD family two-component response regulator